MTDHDETVETGGAERLKDRLRREMTEAMKARDADRLSALRMLAAAVKNEEVRPEVLHELNDEEFQSVASREVKRRREAAEAFAGAGREDRAEKERGEAAVLETYLPAGLSDRELDGVIDQAIEASGASGPGDFGAVMRLVMAQAKGRADGAVVGAKVRRRLGG